MARNSEKAMTALARWRAAHMDDTKVKERRPFLATECDDLHKAEKWRRQIIGEVSRRVAQIQNAGLGEFKLRDLNDEINKLLREKGHWEDRIKELGGPDYRRVGPKMLDHEGKEVPGNRGYKYFGAAKDLPGVRELFEQAPLAAPRKTRTELSKFVDADYYGYFDEDDAIIVPLEREAEKAAILAKVNEYKMRKAEEAEGKDVTGVTATGTLPEEENIYFVQDELDEEATVSKKRLKLAEGQQFIAHVPVPSQKQVEEAFLQRRKAELLEKYVSESLLAETEESKKLLGVKDRPAETTK